MNIIFYYQKPEENEENRFFIYYNKTVTSIASDIGQCMVLKTLRQYINLRLCYGRYSLIKSRKPCTGVINRSKYIFYII